MSATHDNTFWPAGDGGRYHGIVSGLNFQFSKVRPKFVCMIQEPGTDAPVSVRFHNRAILSPSDGFLLSERIIYPFSSLTRSNRPKWRFTGSWRFVSLMVAPAMWLTRPRGSSMVNRWFHIRPGVNPALNPCS